MAEIKKSPHNKVKISPLASSDDFTDAKFK